MATKTFKIKNVKMKESGQILKNARVQNTPFPNYNQGMESVKDNLLLTSPTTTDHQKWIICMKKRRPADFRNKEDKICHINDNYESLFKKKMKQL